VLYLATETGVFVTTAAAKSWVRLRANLPTVPVYEITLHPRDNAMILATHGRALWILDDLTPIQQYARAQGVAGADAAASAFLFDPPPATYRPPAQDRMRVFEGDMKFLGENPPVGAPVTYRLAAKADSVRLVVRDPNGATVRTLEGEATKERLAEGLNTVRWDLRGDPIKPARKVDRGAGGELFEFFGAGGGPEGTPGPIALPGEYRVTLVVNGREVATKPVSVAGDPAVVITAADRVTRQRILEELQRLQAALGDAASAVRAADQQLAAVKKELTDSARVPAAIRSAVDSTSKDLEPIKKLFGVRDPNAPFEFDFAEILRILPVKAGFLTGSIGGVMAPPTRTNLAQLDGLRREAPAAIDSVNTFLERLRGLYRRLAEAGAYPPVPEAVRKP
jgi:hypothetical protein